MLNRNFKTALYISVGAHVLIMSAVTIIVPSDLGRMKPYTRVEFLGSLLRKKAFDIMLEKSPAGYTAVSDYMTQHYGDEYLDSRTVKTEFDLDAFSRYRLSDTSGTIANFLTGVKEVPDFSLDAGRYGFLKKEDRKVVYKPNMPFVAPGAYSGQGTVNVKVKALVGSDGNVKRTEPVTMSGYPQLDMAAEEFVKGWIFESDKSPQSVDEWCEAEVVFNTASDWHD